MSGLCGMIRLDRGESSRAAPDILEEMVAAASYRATGDTAILSAGQALVAELRDAMTASASGEIGQDGLGGVIVADAWLHNRSELIQDLGLATDAAASGVILSSYRRWGVMAPRRLIGEFAFLIWDPSKRLVLAARDPLGMRPLSFAIIGEQLVFASEIAQILRHPDSENRLRTDMVALYLAGSMGRAEETFYHGIYHLPAGHTLVLDGSKRPTLSRYWPAGQLEPVEYKDEAQYVEHFLAVFTQAVTARLDSGLKAGISLSGGLDSGSVAAVAGRLVRRDSLADLPRAYSYAFESFPECDERAVSGLLARALMLPIVDVPGDDAWPGSEWPHHPPDVDEPLIGPFRGLNRRLAEMAASDGVEVILTGMRGDTMMGLGIAEYIDDLLRGRWGRMWRQLQDHSAATGMPIPRLLEVYVLRELRRRVWPTDLAPSVRSSVRRALRRSSPVPPWIHPDLLGEVGMDRLTRTEEVDIGLQGWARRERAAAILSSSDVREVGWLDRLYSRHGVRLTDPWSDQRIAEFAMGVPQRILNAPGEDKKLLRQAMTGVMPEEVRRAASKRSLRPLYDAGLGELGRETVLDLLTGMVSAEMGFVDEPEVRSYYERYISGGSGDFRLWWVLTLETWLRAHWAPGH